MRVLDVRSLTNNIIATTTDPRIAESYLRLRQNDGKNLKNAAITEPCTVHCSLKFPHNGTQLEGIVSKADSMDVKWDIYIYDGIFYFARSWTGELMFKAPAKVARDAINIFEIECRRSDEDLAPSHVFFLLGSHAMGRVLPHRVPLPSDAGPMQIATTSFSLFGNKANYAAFDDITQISLFPKR